MTEPAYLLNMKPMLVTIALSWLASSLPSYYEVAISQPFRRSTTLPLPPLESGNGGNSRDDRLHRLLIALRNPSPLVLELEHHSRC